MAGPLQRSRDWLMANRGALVTNLVANAVFFIAVPILAAIGTVATVMLKGLVTFWPIVLLFLGWLLLAIVVALGVQRFTTWLKARYEPGPVTHDPAPRSHHPTRTGPRPGSPLEQITNIQLRAVGLEPMPPAVTLPSVESEPFRPSLRGEITRFQDLDATTLPEAEVQRLMALWQSATEVPQFRYVASLELENLGARPSRARKWTFSFRLSDGTVTRGLPDQVHWSRPPSWPVLNYLTLAQIETTYLEAHKVYIAYVPLTVSVPRVGLTVMTETFEARFFDDDGTETICRLRPRGPLPEPAGTRAQQILANLPSRPRDRKQQAYDFLNALREAIRTYHGSLDADAEIHPDIWTTFMMGRLREVKERLEADLQKRIDLMGEERFTVRGVVRTAKILEGYAAQLRDGLPPW